MSRENYVGLATDRSGKKVRNFEITTEIYTDATGQWDTYDTNLQTVCIVDCTGNVMELATSESLLTLILEEIRQLRFAIQTAFR